MWNLVKVVLYFGMFAGIRFFPYASVDVGLPHWVGECLLWACITVFAPLLVSKVLVALSEDISIRTSIKTYKLLKGQVGASDLASFLD